MMLSARLWLLFFVIAFAIATALCAPDTGAAESGKAFKASKSTKKSGHKSDRSGRKAKGKSGKKAEKKSVQRSENEPDKKVPGQTVTPEPVMPGTTQHGKASWYGSDFHGGPTASGLAYDMHTFTAAHKTLPIGTVVRVTDKENGKSVMVCVTDRGPFVPGRIIDLSYAAADQLDLADGRGVSSVALEVISDDSGRPLAENTAYYVSYMLGSRLQRSGPFHSFADAAAMHEAVRQVHPEAEVIVDDIR